LRVTAHSEETGPEKLEAAGSSAVGPGPEAAILALQRSAGNRAVAALLQRRTVEQDATLKAALGVTKQENTRTLVGKKPWTVDVYSSNDEPTGGSKLEALSLAGARSGTVGNAVAAHYQGMYAALDEKQQKGKSPTAPWTIQERDLKKEALIQIDPFFLDVSYKYPANDKLQQLTLAFQHADDKQGYVTTVKDTGNPAAAAGVSLVKEAHALPENPLPAEAASNVVDPGSTRYTKYGSAHEDEPGGAENILEMSAGGAEKNFDAYTKLAGEGSRWISVRKHAAYLKNSSRFFAAAPGEGKVFAIEFRKLWRDWASGFKKTYNISDAELVTYLHRERPAELDRNAMGDDDYDCDAGKPFKELRAATATATAPSEEKKE
jgi:hypothetical protein